MSINWFPGHMTAARREAAKTMAKIDVVVELLDARIPGASANPMIGELRRHRQRACVKVLNKADLADPAATAEWLRTFGEEKDVKAVALNCKRPADTATVLRVAAMLAPHRGTVAKPLRILVMGIPNVGKSTFINAVLRRHAAKTGDVPAVTKHQSRHSVSDTVEVIDTPGLMWPKIEHPADGLMLAASHAIGENAYIDEEVATFLGDVLLARYPGLLEARYGIAVARLDGVGLIDAIARKRGYLRRGGVPDRDKAGLALVTDYRGGALGRVSLETPESRRVMTGREGLAA